MDLGATATISQVVLQWETASAKAYQIQVSADGSNWTSVYSTTTGPGGTETLNVTGSGRYIRMYGTARTTGYGYSLWEFQVYGTLGTGGGGTCGTQNAALNQPATASSSENAGTSAAAAVDGNTGTRWSSAFSDPQWLDVDLGSTLTICQVNLNWETAYATAFQIQTSTDNTNWTSIYSTTTATGGNQTLNVTGTGRYIRVYGTARSTQYGYSLWEFGVFTGGSGGGTTSPSSPSSPSTSSTGGGNGNCGTADAALGHPATASSIQDNNPAYDPFYATDGSTLTRWSSVTGTRSGSTSTSAGACRSARCCSSGRTPTPPGSRSRSRPTTHLVDDLHHDHRHRREPDGERHRQRPVHPHERHRARHRLRRLALGLLRLHRRQPDRTIPPPPPQPAPGNCPWLNQPNVAVSTRVAQLMGAMSQDQKAGMLYGDGSSVYIGQIAGSPRCASRA